VLRRLKKVDRDLLDYRSRLVDEFVEYVLRDQDSSENESQLQGVTRGGKREEESEDVPDILTSRSESESPSSSSISKRYWLHLCRRSKR